MSARTPPGCPPDFSAGYHPPGDDQGHTYIYDAWNRIVQVKNGSTVLSSYGYDALSRRITENPGTTTDLYFSSADQVLEERVSGVTKAQYVWSLTYVG